MKHLRPFLSAWSFVRSFLRSFVPSFLRSFVPSFQPSFQPSFLRWFLRSNFRSNFRSNVCSFFGRFVGWCCGVCIRALRCLISCSSTRLQPTDHGNRHRIVFVTEIEPLGGWVGVDRLLRPLRSFVRWFVRLVGSSRVWLGCPFFVACLSVFARRCDSPSSCGAAPRCVM